MKIELKTLTIKNFRGIKSEELTFSSGVTNIYGANGTGKSTVMDAFLWLIHGKDSADRKDHLIKTIDADGAVIPKLDHQVSALVLVNGKEVALSKTYREKWTKKQGSKIAEMTGHEKTHFWNDVPLSETEYKNKIDEILDEKVFKLITNVNHFNRIPWQERRAALFALAGTVENSDVIKLISASGTISLKGLATALDSGKTVSEYKKEISAAKKRLKDELAGIPVRIDEIFISMPEVCDYVTLRIELTENEAEIQRLDYILRSESKKKKEQHDLISAQVDLINSKKNQLKKIEFQELADKQEFDSNTKLASQKKELKKSNLRTNREHLSNTLKSRQGKVDAIEAKMTELRESLKARSSEVLSFDPAEFICPTCQRELGEENKEAISEKLKANFLSKRAKDIAAIQLDGKALSHELNDAIAAIKSTEGAIAQFTIDLGILEDELDTPANAPSQKESNPEYQLLLSQIRDLENEHKAEFEETPDSVLDSSKKSLSLRADQIKAALLTEITISALESRVKELEDNQEKYANQLTKLEGYEFAIEEFTRSKIEMIEDRINGKFNLVTFQMFKTNVNGGVEETCETLYKNKNYSVLNTEGQMVAGIDIITSLSVYYNVSGPIFLDNRESVTIVPEVDTQVINLIVSPQDKKLRIA